MPRSLIQLMQTHERIVRVYPKPKEEQAMWLEAIRIASMGFSVVFITLILLAISIKVMSVLCRIVERKGGKKS